MFSLGPRNLVVAERFSRGTPPVDWRGFSLDPATMSAVLRNGEVPAFARAGTSKENSRSSSQPFSSISVL